MFGGAGLVLPLLQNFLVRAGKREEVLVELGRVPVRGNVPAGVGVMIHVHDTKGRGRWSPGLWWPDEAEPRWPDKDRRLDKEVVGLPILPDEDGTDRDVRVMVRLRPLGPVGACSMLVSSEARMPA